MVPVNIASVKLIYRYPVKGLNGFKMSAAALHKGKGIIGDRAYAIALGSTEFDPAHPVHLRKIKFLTLMTHPKLAQLRMDFDGDGEHVSLFRMGAWVMEGSLRDGPFVDEVNRYLDEFIGMEAKGAPRLVTAPDHMFSDVPEDCLSIINLASITAMEAELGANLDPLRFRANIYLDGLEAWQERGWQEGDEIQIGTARLRIMRPIVRCAAPNVNLQTAEVDVDIPTLLRQKFGQNRMGVYAEVVKGAQISIGDLFKYEDRSNVNVRISNGRAK